MGPSSWEGGDVYSDVMTWFYGGSLAGGKTNRFLEGVQVEPALN